MKLCRLAVLSAMFASSAYGIDSDTLTSAMVGFLDSVDGRGCLLNPSADRGSYNAFVYEGSSNKTFVYLMKFGGSSSCPLDNRVGKCVEFSLNIEKSYTDLCVNSGIPMEIYGEGGRYRVPSDFTRSPTSVDVIKILDASRKIRDSDTSVDDLGDWIVFEVNPNDLDYYSARVFDLSFSVELDLKIATDRVLHGDIASQLAFARSVGIGQDSIYGIGVDNKLISDDMRYWNASLISGWKLIDAAKLKIRLEEANSFLPLEDLSSVNYDVLYKELLVKLLDGWVEGEQFSGSKIKQKPLVLLTD